jgi:hypothetical protein
MQQLALNHAVVWEEICMIQQAILAAASQCQPGGGQMCTTVGGSTPMTFITGVESVDVTYGGTGYVIDNPAIRFVPPLGSLASGATATLTTNGSNILSVNMTSGGTGYQPVLATMSVSSVGGTGAVVEPLVNAAGNIVGVNIVSAGTGYLITDTVAATRAVAANALYEDAEIIITAVGTLGEIVSFAILNSGTGYQPSVTEVEIVLQELKMLAKVTAFPEVRTYSRAKPPTPLGLVQALSAVSGKDSALASMLLSPFMK